MPLLSSKIQKNMRNILTECPDEKKNVRNTFPFVEIVSHGSFSFYNQKLMLVHRLEIALGIILIILINNSLQSDEDSSENATMGNMSMTTIDANKQLDSVQEFWEYVLFVYLAHVYIPIPL